MNKNIYPLLFINIIPSKNSISCTGLQHGVDLFLGLQHSDGLRGGADADLQRSELPDHERRT